MEAYLFGFGGGRPVLSPAMETRDRARLIIIAGLPGSGKTTLALRLAAEVGAVRMNPDEWMISAGIDLWDAASRSSIEEFQRSLAMSMLQGGRSVIIEWGTWGRSERDSLREAARELGVVVELHFLDASVEVLWDRVQARRMELAYGSRPPTLEDVTSWVASLERPTPEEEALYDTPGGGSE